MSEFVNCVEFRNVNADNEVRSESFKSKLDEYFRAKPKPNRATRPSSQARYWAQGIMGVRSPVTKQ